VRNAKEQEAVLAGRAVYAISEAADEDGVKAKSYRFVGIKPSLGEKLKGSAKKLLG
jgi:hypothetical protein